MTATTRTDQRPDVHEMVVVHRTFRREFPAIAGLIRATAEGDTSRAKVVADHLRLCMAGLEMHHTGEDVVLWPLLLERAAPSTGLVETMQAQHHAVDAHVATIEPALDAWQAAPTTATGDHLADPCPAVHRQPGRAPRHGGAGGPAAGVPPPDGRGVGPDG